MDNVSSHATDYREELDSATSTTFQWATRVSSSGSVIPETVSGEPVESPNREDTGISTTDCFTLPVKRHFLNPEEPKIEVYRQGSQLRPKEPVVSDDRNCHYCGCMCARFVARHRPPVRFLVRYHNIPRPSTWIEFVKEVWRRKFRF